MANTETLRSFVKLRIFDGFELREIDGIFDNLAARSVHRLQLAALNNL